MIKLKNPPLPANRVLHMNCHSSSPGGKDYVLALLYNGELWTVYGSATDVRNGRGVERRCDKDMGNVLNEKLRKGYRRIGDYSTGRWHSSIGETYAAVQNIPTKSAPSSIPTPKPAVAPQQQPLSLAEQYPINDMVRNAFSTVVSSNEDWFCVF